MQLFNDKIKAERENVISIFPFLSKSTVKELIMNKKSYHLARNPSKFVSLKIAIDPKKQKVIAANTTYVYCVTEHPKVFLKITEKETLLKNDFGQKWG